MTFSLQHPVAELRRDLRALEKQLRFGAVVAATRTAFDARRAELDMFARVIQDKPTPYTLRGVYAKRATVADPVAEFGIRDRLSPSPAPGHQPATYLRTQIDGGSRDVKAFERRLQQAGHMPQGWVAVPGAAARIDQYGNVSRGQITQILSQLQALSSPSFNGNLRRQLPRNAAGPRDPKVAALRRAAFNRAGGQFFIVKPGESRLAPGVYVRQVLGRRVQGPALPRPRAVFIFARRASYRRRVDWHQVAERAVNEGFDKHVNAAIDQARASAGANRFFGDSDLARSIAGSISWAEAGR